ncbi:hypothetical protein ACIHFD_49500 [Nonomuraea sp. NPDC051941]|uniref:hypothetical protein n=1 Tax=Nonomuraea sp. NPDC051941 TaxID=3364373 RepID=UPI0037C9E7B8
MTTPASDFAAIADYDLQPRDSALFHDSDDPGPRFWRYLGQSVARHAADLRDVHPIEVVGAEGRTVGTNWAWALHYPRHGQAYTIQLHPSQYGITVIPLGGPANHLFVAPRIPGAAISVPYPDGHQDDPTLIAGRAYIDQVDQAITKAAAHVVAALSPAGS